MIDLVLRVSAHRQTVFGKDVVSRDQWRSVLVEAEQISPMLVVRTAPGVSVGSGMMVVCAYTLVAARISAAVVTLRGNFELDRRIGTV